MNFLSFNTIDYSKIKFDIKKPSERKLECFSQFNQSKYVDLLPRKNESKNVDLFVCFVKAAVPAFLSCCFLSNSRRCTVPKKWRKNPSYKAI